jgi:two-component system, cell cycle sensor histidine kinase and response regulator CckA
MSTSLNTPNAKPPVILLVEDESMVREITGQVLSHAGYSVLESSNAKEALQIAGSHDGRIDVLLTDIVMPEMNGADLAQRMQNRQPDLVTIFMSGYAEHDVVKKAKLSSAVHIQKPFTVDTLLSRVSEALNESERR